MKVTVEVTAEDIAKGRRKEATRCPVARAIRRCLHLRSVRVHHGYFVIRRTLHESPGAAKNFVYSFDRKQPVRPFSFTLDVPDA